VKRGQERKCCIQFQGITPPSARTDYDKYLSSPVLPFFVSLILLSLGLFLPFILDCASFESLTTRTFINSDGPYELHEELWVLTVSLDDTCVGCTKQDASITCTCDSQTEFRRTTGSRKLFHSVPADTFLIMKANFIRMLSLPASNRLNLKKQKCLKFIVEDALAKTKITPVVRTQLHSVVPNTLRIYENKPKRGNFPLSDPI
jgi:hypothetical protein